MERRRDSLTYGKGLFDKLTPGGRGGGGAFAMPKGTTGSTPKMNRLGQTKTPVKKLESNAESYVQSLPDATRRAMQEKAFPRILETPPAGKLKQKQALRGEEFQRRYEGARDTRDAARQARKDKFGIKFEQGGPVRSSRDYGK